MSSPYRSTVAYRGESFVSMSGKGRNKIKGTLHKEGVGMTPEEKESLAKSLYSWKQEENEKESKET
jgi:hypothetical protein